ncbi:hypothetical protein D3C79_739060 [compost metagenome]
MHFFRRRGQLGCRIAHVLDGVPQTRLHGDGRAHQVGQFILTGNQQLGTQVTFGDLAVDIQYRQQRHTDAASEEDAENDTQANHQRTDTDHRNDRALINRFRLDARLPTALTIEHHKLANGRLQFVGGLADVLVDVLDGVLRSPRKGDLQECIELAVIHSDTQLDRLINLLFFRAADLLLVALHHLFQLDPDIGHRIGRSPSHLGAGRIDHPETFQAYAQYHCVDGSGLPDTFHPVALDLHRRCTNLPHLPEGDRTKHYDQQVDDDENQRGTLGQPQVPELHVMSCQGVDLVDESRD